MNNKNRFIKLKINCLTSTMYKNSRDNEILNEGKSRNETQNVTK